MCWSGTVYVWFWIILSKDASLQCSAAFETQHTVKFQRKQVAVLVCLLTLPTEMISTTMMMQIVTSSG